MVASAIDSIDMVRRLLLVEGCDPNLVSPNGETAHSLANGPDHMEIVRLLEENSFIPA